MSRECRVRRGGTSIGIAFRFDSRSNQCSSSGFGQYNFGGGAVFLDVLSRAVECSPGTISRNPVIQSHALEIIAYLRPCGFVVEFPIGIGFELTAEEPAVLRGEFGGLFDHAGSLSGFGRYDDSCSEHAHQFASFDGEGFGHDDDAGIAALGAHHGHGNASITRSSLHHRLTRLERSILLGSLDNRQRQTILHRGERIEVFAFGVDGSTCGTNPIR
mmetsp:Transcript_19713/g.35445  ORF Transcript_19713/g.35445 Transcript_19713/m.35445 type:complete len:216 (+) Transcript_19713:630-1277(+)